MGRFLIGFIIGLLIGAAAALLASPRSGRPQALGETVDGVLSAARRASDLKQQEMWAEYRARIQQQAQPKPPAQKPRERYER
jgi:gas vesicle protein